MRLVSWNVNGIRACLGKGSHEALDALDADVICLQEVKAREEQVSHLWFSQWSHVIWNPAEKPGYSGVAVLSKVAPLSFRLGMDLADHDREGRVIAVEYEKFFLVNVYTPNSQDGLVRLPYRMEWDKAFREYVSRLDQAKPVVFCGDLNVAHEEIDIARPATNHFSPGFSDDERASFSCLLGAGFSDTFRQQHPDKKDAYSWWSYRGGARERNVGWRIDYFCVSDRIMPQVRATQIFPEITGSDHCPVYLDIDL